MIHKYQGKNFLGFRHNILNYIEQNYSVISQNAVTKNIVEILKDILKEENLEILYVLDNYDLMFHNWSSLHDSINDGTLGTSNNLLYAFSESHKTQLIGEPINVIESLYLVLYADIYEALLISEDSKTRFSLNKIIRELQNFSSSLSSDNFHLLTQIWFIIPREVFTKHLNQHLDNNVLDTVKSLQTNDDFIKERISISNNLKQDIERIKTTLDEQKTEYNFVGLSKGFTSLKDNKVTELESEKSVYKWLMGIIITLIIVKSVWSAYYLSVNDINSPMFIIITISTVLFLFILLYFFRISLINVKSIKSQILQIDLRLTLCQFIHNYDSNTKDLREGMKESFGKFESVIFSPLVATEDQMPSTFDGLEQLTGMIGLFNKKSD